ncbi:hypothetical protein A3A69_00665 [candidate division WWE3 bacterium RIFCSPLOWO2_01_FULL_37_15]|uniref:M23ase beta-sheet core domain-containing protein n=1 Tax=candidate division WWE3 bacterium RIFCSPLOWO2_01_FULL_37_15 TaxID=1802622 RepID=A0A1F4UZA7_UNCKA|nr:MAG: hypothetical protein A3A69_00665 [candidate division WWE3 bacterium RIFCSPLOWO2_01_FULL_37_15]
MQIHKTIIFYSNRKLLFLIIWGLLAATIMISQGFKTKAQENSWELLPLNKKITSLETTHKGIIAGELDTRAWLNPYNGVYISEDLGHTWKESGLRSAGIKDLFYDADNKTIYAATYFFANGQAGAFKSSDNGLTWTHIGDSFSSNKIWAQGDNIFLGTFSHGLWVSNDGGTNWSQKIGEGFFGPQINALNGSENVVLAATGTDLYKSINNGSDWTTIDTFNNKTIEDAEIVKNVILVSTKSPTQLYISYDNGNSWELMNDFNNERITLIKLFNNKLYFGKSLTTDNYLSIYESDDFGNTFKDLGLSKNTFAQIMDLTWLFSYPNLLYTVNSENKIYKYTFPIGINNTGFFDIPWGFYTERELVTKIYSHFDHEYPLLGYTEYQEPTNTRGTTLNFLGVRDKEPFLYYSSHDGYDFSLKYGTNILAPAGGFAEYFYCKPCGNSININHLNGYQTTYMHLQKNGLATDLDNTVWVNKGDTIGKVGMTGNTSGPHLHFAVLQDKNNNGLFDDTPDGRVDPYSWLDTKTKDPWESFSWTDRTGRHEGSKSTYLWNYEIESYAAYIRNKSDENTILQNETHKIEIPNNSYDIHYSIVMKPFSIPSIYTPLSYVPGSSIVLTAVDYFNTDLVNLLHPIKITFNIADANTFIPESLNFYFWDPLNGQWKQMETILESANNQIYTTTDHLSNFAVFGQKLDSIFPTTNIVINGTLDNGWYKTQPTVILTTGSTEDLPFYSVDNNAWEEFTAPFSPGMEGIFTIQYRALDSAGNTEETKDELIRVNVQNKWENTIKIKQNLFIFSQN